MSAAATLCFPGVAGLSQRTSQAQRSSACTAFPRLLLRSTAAPVVAGASPARHGRVAGGRASKHSFVTNASRSSVSPVVYGSGAGAPVALVTGGTRGIGLAIAMELAKEGCKLVLNHVSDKGVEDAITACMEAGAADVATFQGDVSQKENVDAMIKFTTETFGSIDVLVNNAGITRDTLILRMKPEQWQQVIDVNLTGVFYCAQAAAKVMSKQRSGRIVNITSVVGQLGNAGQANYSAAKGGVIAMTKTFAREFASRGICVNAVAPGFIKSDMTAAIDLKYEGAILAQIPLGRMGEPSEVAGLVRYLAVDPSSLYVTGHTFNVDGGMAM
eukprot:CAMPEP_0117668570 /NCGR_PEP_ID=MMETSP0804-20121206/11625_1 /TAXON_ID=1074897 /ORGANISM="Tetraselmis astigmatica, Strain CCMP880" /LENGTH=328 /DNA_ID=CAMNT_0005476481 /DNA_START=102 /DNA_END=1088 /DNA_ORIENTATION=-